MWHIIPSGGTKMRKSLLFVICLLILLASSANAFDNCNNNCDCNCGCDCNGEMICFDDMKCGEDITDQFTGQGATFESSVVAYRMLGSETAYSSEKVTVTFDPEVCCVSMEVNSVYGVQIIAYDKDGNVVDTAQGGIFLCPKIVELSAKGDSSIAYVTLTASSLKDMCNPKSNYISTKCCTYKDWLYIDNLKFCKCQDNEIPEFPGIAIPMMAIMGLALVMQRRKQ
nr:PEF-CTERM sorting domain-containing protein [uncultured Methanolobus sp.]